MREIKFRVIITGNDKEKIAEFTEWLDGDGWKHDYYAPMVTNRVFSHEELGDGWMGEIIRDQYTGLPDKNKKDIYENDILCWPEHEGRKHQTRWVVKWNENKAAWSDYSPREQAEAIGNVHENPELLRY